MKLRPILDLLVPVALVGGAFVILSFAACSSTQQHKAEAESAYGAELQACVANSDNRVEADVCADKVRTRWAFDAGTEAGK